MYQRIEIGNHQLGRKQFFLPSNINSLTPSQYFTLVRCSEMQDIQKARILLFWSLLDIPINRKNLRWLRWELFKNDIIGYIFNRNKSSVLDLESLMDAVDYCTDFLYKDATPIVINPLKKLRIGLFKSSKAREDALGDFTIEEFIKSEVLYEQLILGDSSVTNQLINLLYYTDISKVDDITRKAIILYYENCRGFVFKSFPLTFPSSGNKSSDSSIEDAYKLTIHTLANEDVSKYDEISKTNLWDCLYAHEMKLKNLLPK